MLNKPIKILIVIMLSGLILNGVALLIAKQNIVDLTKYWLAAAVQMNLTINPPPSSSPSTSPAPQGTPYVSPIIPGPTIEGEITSEETTSPEEETVEEVWSEEEILPVEETSEEITAEESEEISTEKIVKIPEETAEVAETPEIGETPEIIKVPETPQILSKEVLVEWSTEGVTDGITGISGLVSWSISALAPIIPAPPELPQTIDETPTFSGVASVPFALISIELFSDPITGETQADENGHWSWTSPQPLSLGLHTLNITIQDPADPSLTVISSQEFKVISEKSAEEIKEVLFDVSLTVQAKDKKVYPGDDLLVVAEIIKFEPKERIDIPLHYQIRDEKEKVILDYTETMAIGTRLSFLKIFHITEEATTGQYKIFLEVPYNNTFVSSSDSFEIVKRPLFVTPGVITLTARELLGGLGLIFGLFLISFISFGIFLYREFIKTRGTRKISSGDLGDQALTKKSEELLKEAQRILEEGKKQ